MKTYNQVLNEVIQSILNAYDEDSIDLSPNGQALQLTYLDVLDEDNAPAPVRFYIVGLSEKTDKQGIHTFPDDDLSDLGYRVENALHSCERDGFEAVYIHVQTRKGA